jgi:hypothetical protein
MIFDFTPEEVTLIVTVLRLGQKKEDIYPYASSDAEQKVSDAKIDALIDSVSAKLKAPIIASRVEGVRKALDGLGIAQLRDGICPDCGRLKLRLGPKGGLARNVACGHCGAEFNDMVFRVERNSPKGQPDIARLRDVYGIEL